MAYQSSEKSFLVSVRARFGGVLEPIDWSKIMYLSDHERALFMAWAREQASHATASIRYYESQEFTADLGEPLRRNRARLSSCMEVLELLREGN